MRKLLPALVLFFLAPAIAELLLGSAPPAEFFTPFGFIMLVVLYGSGAILIRELVIRWQKGWFSLLTLGAAYALVEEGLLCKSFFDPNWMDIGILGSYGRWASVNWVWSLELTFYHAIVSIAIPILLVELIFPHRRHQSWVGKKLAITLGVLLAIEVAFGYFWLTDYRPGAIGYFLAMAVAAVLGLIAWRLPRQPFAPRSVTARHPAWFWLIGFLGTIVFFIIIFWGLPNTGLHPLVTIVIGLVYAGGVGLLVMRLSGNGGAFTDKHRFALAAGPLTWLILTAPFQELDASRTDNTSGMAIVGGAALLFLLWVGWQVIRRAKES